MLGRVAAPSAVGTVLRAFTFGHVRQLDQLLAETLTRAWASGAGPGEERLTVDVDSFIGEVHGYKKPGAAFGYTRQRGYHPLLATRAETGEVLHIRLRTGRAASPRGVLRFADELIARVERAGAGGTKLFRADSAFWNKKLLARLVCAGWTYSISIAQQTWVKAAIAQIPEPAWRTLEDYPQGGEAQIAETEVNGHRLIVRRTRLIGPQAELWPDWRHFAFDLKDQALAHFPSGKFNANAAWAVIACLAHNLLCWSTLIGLPNHTVRTSRTIRRRLLSLPGRLTTSGRQ